MRSTRRRRCRRIWPRRCAPGAPAPRRAQEQAERIEQVTTTLGIDHLLERFPRELSNGQRQRVALGRVLVRPADVYLLDEPLLAPGRQAARRDAGRAQAARRDVRAPPRSTSPTTTRRRWRSVTGWRCCGRAGWCRSARPQEVWERAGRHVRRPGARAAGDEPARRPSSTAGRCGTPGRRATCRPAGTRRRTPAAGAGRDAAARPGGRGRRAAPAGRLARGHGHGRAGRTARPARRAERRWSWRRHADRGRLATSAPHEGDTVTVAADWGQVHVFAAGTATGLPGWVAGRRRAREVRRSMRRRSPMTTPTATAAQRLRVGAAQDLRGPRPRAVRGGEGHRPATSSRASWWPCSARPAAARPPPCG